VTKGSKALDEFAARWMRRWKVPGASLALVERGRPTFARGYGFRDRENELPTSARTVYGVASITKSFTALAILRLEEEGKLSTQDPVLRHLPEFRTPDARATRRITLHHFLTHSSGLPPLPSIYYTSARSLARDPPYDPRVARRVGIDPDHTPIDTYEQLMEFLGTTRYQLLGPPGRYFSYSNEGFGLLGPVIERVSGRTYESYLEEEVLRPAGMTSTTFDTGIMLRLPEVTTLYSPKWSGTRHGLVPSQDWWDDTCLRACGGLRSTAEDLGRYVHIFFDQGRVEGKRVLSAASIKKMVTPYIGVSPGLQYGYGVAIRPDYHGTPLVYHEGGLKGVSSIFAVAPERRLAGAVLANADLVPSDQLLMAAINDRLGIPRDTPLVDVPRPTQGDPSLDEYAGWYCSGEGIWLQVTALRNTLRFDFRGIEATDRDLRFRPAGNDAFVLRRKGVGSSVRFERDPAGQVWAAFQGWRLLRRRDPRELPRARKGLVVW
jgi:CubicO group peptidase (beta-lactamase class C family)